MRYNASAIFAVLTFLGFSAPAWADATSDAQLANFRYLLTDLDATDGVAPAITFNNSAISEAQTYIGSQSTALVQQSAGAFGPASSTTQVGSSIATAVVSGGDLAHLSATAHATAVNYLQQATALAIDRNLDLATLTYLPMFTLTAHTSITFFADFTGAVQAYAPNTAPPGAKSVAYGDLATAFVTSATRPYREDFIIVNPGESVGRTMSVALDNFSAAAQTGYLSYGVMTTAIAGAVPEPGSLMLMLGGLVGLGLLCDRRKPSRFLTPSS